MHCEGRILLVDDEEGILITIGDLLRKEGFDVETAPCCADAESLIRSIHFDLALLDLHLPDGSGIDLLLLLKSLSPATAVAVFTGSPDLTSAMEAVRQGAVDYITKPMRFETIRAVTRHAMTAKRLAEEREKNHMTLETILRTIPDGIIMVDREGILLHANDRSRQTCGYTTEEIGKPLSTERIPCEGRCRSLLLASIETGEELTLRRTPCRRSGQERVVTVTATPVRDHGGVVRGGVAVIHDETDLVTLEKGRGKRVAFSGLVGGSEAMQRIYSLIEALRDLPSTVLITGETGTGKELVARAIHGDWGKPFVAVNCAALSSQILESELFGHVRGAYTGAFTDRIGRFEAADGGTLFLDEIGEISPTVQVKLLRFLHDGTFERVGSCTPRRVNVRVIAATNRNLEKMVADGRFREDLYWRLKVVKLTLPPLRERKEDIPLLVDHFIRSLSERYRREITGVSDDVLSMLRSHPFPGNVRELEHMMEHALVVCQGGVILAEHLPINSDVEPVLAAPPIDRVPSLQEALERAGGNKSKAAQLLGISRRTLYRHLGGDHVGSGPVGE
ncbi:MAG: sigma-54 dependent transcriptional regulator [Desulfuromonadia bacterium]